MSASARLSRLDYVPAPTLDPGGVRARTAPPVRIRSLDPVPVPGPPRRAGVSTMRALFTGLVMVAAVAAVLAVAAAYLSGGPPGGDQPARVVTPPPQAPLPDPVAAAPPAADALAAAPAELASLAAAATPTVEAVPARSPAKLPPVQRASADMTDWIAQIP